MQLLSFVIPCYRSEQTIETVVSEIRDKMATLPEYEWELVLVNDCSPDGTINVLKGLAAKDERITIIDFARNFGQHSALMAGLRQTKGDIVVCLDDDGQTPANQVDRLLGALDKGADVAYARYDHKKHSAFRNFGSHVNEMMARFMLGKPKTLQVSSYFAAKRYIVNDMIRYENSYPYVIGLVLRSTNNIVNVDVDHRAREIGASGYTLKKLLDLWMNGFTSFSVKPLRIATVIGIFAAIAGFIYGIVIVVQHFILPDRVQGYASVMAVLIIFGGLIMIMLGLIGEYVGRIYISLNNSPQYVIKEIYRKENESGSD
ncbi:MAG: glycosyltransferase family 2 protein [Lachnospiraceae bacterium]|nr:glycosyltransferase family 2 protein [Lachnospiraceae bacterium]